MNRNRVFAAIAVLVLVSSSIASAQVITGSISGTVADETGAVLPGVEVTINNLDTGLSRTAISDDRGAYRAPSLPVGPYEVRAELAGFQTVIRTGISLTVGRQAVVNLELRVGEITEQVIVTGEASLVETTQSTVADLVDEQKIRDLPLNGRDFTQLALLQAGVVLSISAPRAQIGNEGQKISIAGTRSTQTAVLLDGTDIRNELNTTPGGASGALLGVETVQEFQVITGVFSAEYGKFTGGVINAVTKSGTNQFHGNIYEFHRNSALDARNFFDQEEVPAFKRNQFGFTLGGPITPDKTFFFGGYEGFRERLLNSEVSPVPNDLAIQGLIPLGRGGACSGEIRNGLCFVGVAPEIQPYLDLYPAANGQDNGDGTAEFIWPANRPTNEDYFMVKVDHQFSDSDSFFVRYTLNQGDRFTQTRLPLFGQDATYRNQYTTLEWKRILTPALINEVRFGYTRSKHDVLPVDLFGTDPSLLFIPLANRVFGEVTVARGQVEVLGPVHNQHKTNAFNNFQTTDNLIYTRGRHALKFGFDWQRFQFNFLNFARASGIYEFPNLEGLLRAEPNLFDGFVNDFSTIGMRQSLFGFYIQDDITVKPNLTVNLGLRYEFITEPTEVAGRLGNMNTPLDPEIRLGNPYFENPSLKNFSPRLGLAWDPFGDGKTSVRAGFGLFFDQILTNYYGSPVQQSPPNIHAFVSNPSFPDEFSLLPPLDEIKVGPWVIFNPEQPYIIQYSLNIQRELFPNGVFLIGYSGSRGVHLGRFTNANVAVGERLADGRWFFDPALNLQKRNSNFEETWATTWDSNSFYNALRLSFTKRYSHRHQFQLSYTFSRLIDEGTGTSFFNRGSSGDNIWTTLFDDHRFDKGLSGNNIAQAFAANYTVDLPGENLQGAMGHILGGWQVGGILTGTTGEQMTILITFDQAGMDAGSVLVQRPDLVPGVDPFIGDTPRGYLNPDAFAVPQPGFLGNLGRGTFTGPGRFTFDLSLVKKVQLGENESRNLQFRAEFFNLFNNVNFGRPGTRIFVSPGGRTSGSFGVFRSTVTTSRQIQFALKIAF